MVKNMDTSDTLSGDERWITTTCGGTRHLLSNFFVTWALSHGLVPCWVEIREFMTLVPRLSHALTHTVITSRVKTRLQKGDGMSFAEFSYPLMQAWDWWVLFRKGVQVQVGGSDQYGNILFGMDAVKSISRNTADEQVRNPLTKLVDRPIGLTTPLLTTSSGEKLGKTAGNGIWLDKDMTSTFELYQVCCPSPRL